MANYHMIVKDVEYWRGELLRQLGELVQQRSNTYYIAPTPYVRASDALRYARNYLQLIESCIMRENTGVNAVFRYFFFKKLQRYVGRVHSDLDIASSILEWKPNVFRKKELIETLVDDIKIITESDIINPVAV